MEQAAGRRVLVIDDDDNLRYVVCTGLRIGGWTVAESERGHGVLGLVESFRPHVIVLDVMLGDGERDGFELCEMLRRRAITTPVLFLTARGGIADRLHGLGIGGGDDYLVKPFSVEELLARCRLLARRGGSVQAAPAVLAYADLEIDDDTHRATRQGRHLQLSATEYRLLRYLLLNAGRVISRQQILDRVWDGSSVAESNVESFVSLLRRKVDAIDPKLIHTVRGFGYVLRIDAGDGPE